MRYMTVTAKILITRHSREDSQLVGLLA